MRAETPFTTKRQTMKPSRNNSSGLTAGKPAPSPGAASNWPKVNSDTLFGSRHEIVIVHNNGEYRLRITRAGKLILTK